MHTNVYAFHILATIHYRASSAPAWFYSFNSDRYYGKALQVFACSSTPLNLPSVWQFGLT